MNIYIDIWLVLWFWYAPPPPPPSKSVKMKVAKDPQGSQNPKNCNKITSADDASGLGHHRNNYLKGSNQPTVSAPVGKFWEFGVPPFIGWSPNTPGKASYTKRTQEDQLQSRIVGGWSYSYLGIWGGGELEKLPPYFWGRFWWKWSNFMIERKVRKNFRSGS